MMSSEQKLRELKLRSSSIVIGDDAHRFEGNSEQHDQYCRKAIDTSAYPEAQALKANLRQTHYSISFGQPNTVQSTCHHEFPAYSHEASLGARPARSHNQRKSNVSLGDGNTTDYTSESHGRFVCQPSVSKTQSCKRLSAKIVFGSDAVQYQSSAHAATLAVEEGRAEPMHAVHVNRSKSNVPLGGQGSWTTQYKESMIPHPSVMTKGTKDLRSSHFTLSMGEKGSWVSEAKSQF